MPVKVPRETLEKLETTITSDVDPTGDVVEFAFVQGEDRPTTWVAGSWDGAWTDGEAVAVTPTIGLTGSGAAIELAVGKWTGYVKVTDAPEAPVRECGKVTLG